MLCEGTTSSWGDYEIVLMLHKVSSLKRCSVFTMGLPVMYESTSGIVASTGR